MKEREKWLMDILKEIQDLIPDLTRTQKRIAKYILDNPDAVCFLPLKKLSDEIGVTETTILNFCKKTKAETFSGLKKAMHGYLQDRMRWNNKLETSSKRYAADEVTLTGLQQSQLQLMQATMDGVDANALFEFVDALSQAENIYICGHAASLTIAGSLQHKLRDTGALTRLVNVADYAEVLDALTRFDENDVFILITLPFYSAQTVAISDYLRRENAVVLAMTDKLSSPIVRNARHTLLCSSDSMIFHNSIASMAAMADIIASLYILQNKQVFEAYNSKVKLIEDFFKTSTIPAFDNEYYFNDKGNE